MRIRLIGSLFLFLVALSAQRPEITSSAVSEAAEQLTGRRAHITNEIHLLAGARLAGPAVTLHLVRDEKASSIAINEFAPCDVSSHAAWLL